MRLAAAFPLSHVPESTITLYRSKLERCDTDLIVGVIERAIESAKTFPTIAELRHDYAGEISRQGTVRPALPMAGTPMPESIKKQMADLFKKMDERSAELEGQS